MHQAFALFDADDNGTINVCDMEKVLRSLGQEVTSTDLQTMMETLHIDTSELSYLGTCHLKVH